jgi:hypothetical protein
MVIGHVSGEDAVQKSGKKIAITQPWRIEESGERRRE